MIAVLDADLVLNWHRLREHTGIDFFDRFRSIASGALLPEQVLLELNTTNEVLWEPQLMEMLFLATDAESEFYRYCDQYDPAVVQTLAQLQNVDKGEAGAVAQAFSQELKWFLMDDKKAALTLRRHFKDLVFHNSWVVLELLKLRFLILPHEAELVAQYLKAYYPTKKPNSQLDEPVKYRLLAEEWLAQQAG